MRSVCGSRVVITVCPGAGQAVTRELGPAGEGSVPAARPGRRWFVRSEEAQWHLAMLAFHFSCCCCIWSLL